MLEPNKDIIKIKLINYLSKKMLDGYTNSIINTYFRKPIQKKTPSLDLQSKIFSPSMTNSEYFNEGSDNEDSSQSLSSNLLCLDENSDKNKINEKKKKNFRNMSDSHKRERKIGYIIEKVYAWRKLYNGFKDDKNKYVKYSLDKAAEQVGVSKKSLDDYLLQLRLGRNYRFDFDENKYKKIGVLRDFVKKAFEKDETKVKKKRYNKKSKKNDEKKIENIIIKDDNKKDDKKITKENLKEKEIKNTLGDLDLKKSNSKGNSKSISLIGKKRKIQK